MTPLQAYLKIMRNTVPRSELGALLDDMATFCGIPRVKLYQAADPDDSHILKPGPAMLLDLYTLGLVPAESTNPDMGAIKKAMHDWIAMRRVM